MVNRLGKKYLPYSEPVDRTANLVSNIMLAKPPIQNCELMPDGNVRFQLLLKDTGLTAMDLRHAKLMRSRWFANAIGEFLVRCHPHQFDALILGSDYPQSVRKKIHGGFGYRITNEFIEFKFCCELLHRLFNEAMKQEVRQAIT